MSQRFLFDEDHQPPAKIIRAMIWSGTMGLLWALPFVVWVGASITLFWMTGTFSLRESLQYFLLFSIYLAWIPVILGAVSGFIAALCASASECLWGLRASTFRTFNESMIRQLVVLGVILLGVSTSVSQNIALGLASIGFIIALGRTLTYKIKQRAA